MSERLLRLREGLGTTGLAGLALIVLAAAFAFLVVKPLQARNALLAERAAQLASRAGSAQPGGAAGKIDSVYGFLQHRQEQTTDWLAKLHGIGAATGVRVKSATYKTQPTDSRIVRYELVLPVSGSYPQIRDFLKRSLAEIPVLSVDQMTLKRDERAGQVHAELRLTFHRVKS
jgi:hypothetical protein